MHVISIRAACSWQPCWIKNKRFSSYLNPKLYCFGCTYHKHWLSLGMDLSNKTIRFLNNSLIGKRKNHNSFQYSCRTRTWCEVAYTTKHFYSVPLGNKTAWYLALAGEVGALGKILISPPVPIPTWWSFFFRTETASGSPGLPQLKLLTKFGLSPHFTASALWS